MLSKPNVASLNKPTSEVYPCFFLFLSGLVRGVGCLMGIVYTHLHFTHCRSHCRMMQAVSKSLVPYALNYFFCITKCFFSNLQHSDYLGGRNPSSWKIIKQASHIGNIIGESGSQCINSHCVGLVLLVYASLCSTWANTLQCRHNERDCLKSPASRLFTRPFIQAQIKESIKVPLHWLLRGKFTGDQWIPRTKGQ